MSSTAGSSRPDRPNQGEDVECYPDPDADRMMSDGTIAAPTGPGIGVVPRRIASPRRRCVYVDPDFVGACGAPDLDPLGPPDLAASRTLRCARPLISSSGSPSTATRCPPRRRGLGLPIRPSSRTNSAAAVVVDCAGGRTSSGASPAEERSPSSRRQALSQGRAHVSECHAQGTQVGPSRGWLRSSGTKPLPSGAGSARPESEGS
jgi:hypothetical protein